MWNEHLGQLTRDVLSELDLPKGGILPGKGLLSVGKKSAKNDIKGLEKSNVCAKIIIRYEDSSRLQDRAGFE